MMLKAKGKTKKTVSAHPSCVTEDGTIYRVILSLTCEDGKESYLATGSRLTHAEVDNKLGHANSLAKNLSIYLDKDHKELKSLGFQCPIFHQYGISQDICQEFDELNIHEFKAVFDHIHKLYRESINANRKSGHHGNYENYIGGHYWLMLLRNRVSTVGTPELQQLTYPELPNVVSTLGLTQDTPVDCDGPMSSQDDSLCNNFSLSPRKKRLAEDIGSSHASRKRIMVTMEKQKNLQLTASIVDRRESLVNKIIETKQKMRDLDFDEEVQDDLKTMISIYKDQIKKLDVELNKSSSEVDK